MKLNGHLVGIILLITSVIFVSGCSSTSFLGNLGKETEEKATETPGKTVESEKTEEPAAGRGAGLIGTWINTEYNNENRSAMVVYDNGSDGIIVYKAYDNADGSGDSYEGTVEMVEVWTDPEGRTNIKSTVTITGGMSWETLTRMNGDGTMLEVQSGTETINPDGQRYSIYYRE